MSGCELVGFLVFFLWDQALHFGVVFSRVSRPSRLFWAPVFVGERRETPLPAKTQWRDFWDCPFKLSATTFSLQGGFLIVTFKVLSIPHQNTGVGLHPKTGGPRGPTRACPTVRANCRLGISVGHGHAREGSLTGVRDSVCKPLNPWRPRAPTPRKRPFLQVSPTAILFLTWTSSVTCPRLWWYAMVGGSSLSSMGRCFEFVVHVRRPARYFFSFSAWDGFAQPECSAWV